MRWSLNGQNLSVVKANVPYSTHLGKSVATLTYLHIIYILCSREKQANEQYALLKKVIMFFLRFVLTAVLVAAVLVAVMTSFSARIGS